MKWQRTINPSPITRVLLFASPTILHAYTAFLAGSHH